MHYDVCISFEGTYRDYARELANALKTEGICLGRLRGPLVCRKWIRLP